MFVIYIEEYGYYEGEIYRNDGETYPSAELQTVDSPFIKLAQRRRLLSVILKRQMSLLKSCLLILLPVKHLVNYGSQ